MEEWQEVKSGELWTPEAKGDSVEGVLIAKTEGQYGDNYELETTNGIATLPTLTVLTTKMKRVEIGSKVRIEYKGKILSKSGKEYKDFQVFTAKNWEQVK